MYVHSLRTWGKCVKISKTKCIIVILSHAAGEDYNSALTILSLPVGSKEGASVCTSISIINNNETEDVEYFSVHAEVVDLNIKVSRRGATINIIDDDIPGCVTLAR